MTLDLYAQRVAEVIGEEGEPVILVGHSMGGIAVTQAAELRPSASRGLVYVTAFLPKDGESLQYLAGLPENPVDIVVPNCEIVPPDAIIPEWAARAAVYHRCSEDDVKAVARLNPQPLAAPRDAPCRSPRSARGASSATTSRARTTGHRSRCSAE